MINIEYSKSKNRLYVKTVKEKVVEHQLYSADINEAALCFVKKYFENTIIEICNGRINAYEHTYEYDYGKKKEFFMRLKCSVTQALKYPTWSNYLVTCFRNLREFSPNESSRFYKNYMGKIDMMEAVLTKHVNAEKHYTEKNEQLEMFFTDNQTVTQYAIY